MKKTKRIMAIAAICILVLMYVLSLVFAVLNVPNWQRLFFASMGATVILPVFVWINMTMYGHMMDKRELKEGEAVISHGKK